MTQRTKKIRNDLILITALLAVVIIGGLCLWLLGGEGDTVTVTVDGATYGVYPLSQDREVVITTDRGTNTLVIRDGKALVTDADCPDGICADHRPIHRNGESIVCLPNKVVATVSTAETDAPDMVV